MATITPCNSQLGDSNGSLIMERSEGNHTHGNECMEDLSDRDFFDLEDDDEHITSYSTTNSVSDIWAQSSKQQQQIHELKKLLQDKSQEHDAMTQQATDTRKKLDEKEKRLCMLEEQLEEAFQEKQQSQDLLVHMQTTCKSQENSIEKLREDKRQLEQSNFGLEAKLYQCQILQTVTKRYIALESDFEAMLLENDVKINELHGSLGLARTRCHQLEPEKICQQQYIKELEDKIASFEQTIFHLSKNFAGAQEELNAIDALLLKTQTHLRPQGDSATLSHLNRALAHPKDMSDKIIKLQELLEGRERDLQLLREKESQSLGKLAALSEDKTRQDARIVCMEKELAERQQMATSYWKLQQKIQPLIAERDALREHYQKGENQLKRIQVDLLRVSEDNERLKQTCDRLSDDNWKLTTKRDRTEELRLELDRNRDLLAQTQMKLDRLSKLQADTTRDNEILTYKLGKLQDVDKELVEQRQQYANLKRNNLKTEQMARWLKTEKDSLQEELQELQKKCEQEKVKEQPVAAANCSKTLEKLNDIGQAEIEMTKLKKINKRQAKIIKAYLGDVDKTVDKTEDLTTDVKRNVKQFKDYIKEQNKSAEKTEHKETPSTNYETSESCQGVGISTEASLTSTEHISQTEQRYRDQMAREVQKAEEKYQRVCAKVEPLLSEVEMLRRTIMEERGKTANILNAKNEELKALMGKCCEKERCIDDLKQSFDDVFSNIESERQSMKTVLSQWESEKVEIQQVEQYWQDKMANLQNDHRQALQSSHHRYQAAMQTAQNHKMYAEEKVREHKESLAKLEISMQLHLEEYKKRSAQQQREPIETEQRL